MIDNMLVALILNEVNFVESRLDIPAGDFVVSTGFVVLMIVLSPGVMAGYLDVA